MASVVAGLLGFCTAGLGSLVGLVVGILAIGTIRRHRLAGQGIAVTGISVSAAGLLIGPGMAGLVAAVVVPGLAVARENAVNNAALLSLRELTATARAYAAEHDDALPPADDWVNELRRMRGTLNVTSPMAPQAGRGYAMNRNLNGRRIGDVAVPNLTVLFFEIDPGGPLAGGPELLPSRARYRLGYAITFVDGRTTSIPRERLHELVWD